MKTVAKVLMLVAVLSVPVFAQRTVQATYSSGFRNSVTTTTGTWDLELWADNRGTGGIQCTLFNNGSFSGNWTDGYNTLLRIGKKFQNNTSITSLGTATNQISLRYDVSNFRSNRGATYMTVYGWTRNQMTEWYIMDDWRHWHPPTNNGNVGTSGDYRNVGTVNADGGVYDVIVATRTNQPSIDGTATFLQIFSIRRNPTRTSGTINVSAHFNRWEELVQNISVGGQNISFTNSSHLYEVSFCLEGFGGETRSSGGGSVNNLCIKWGGTASTRLCTWGGCTNCNTTTQGNFSLTTIVEPAAAGTITRSVNQPAGGYAPNTSVTLTRPSPSASEWVFSSWSGGGCTGTGPTCVVTMSADREVTATFTRPSTFNLIQTGALTGTGSTVPTPWTLNQGEHYGNSAATFSLGAAGATINVTTAGREWEPQFAQQNIALTQGQTYTLTFTARAVSGTRTLIAQFGQSSGDYETYAQNSFNLTTAAQPFTYTFTMDAASDPNVQFAFNLGGTGMSGTGVILSNVTLTQSTGTNISLKNSSAQINKQGLNAALTPNGRINVAFRASVSGTTTINLYNLKGGLIASEKIRTVSGTNYSHALSTGKLSNGIYVVDVQGGDGRVEQARVVIPK